VVAAFFLEQHVVGGAVRLSLMARLRPSTYRSGPWTKPKGSPSWACRRTAPSEGRGAGVEGRPACAGRVKVDQVYAPVLLEGFRPKKQLAGSAQLSSNCAAFPVRQEPQSRSAGLRCPSRLRTEAGNLLTRRSKSARLALWSSADSAKIGRGLVATGSREQTRGQGSAARVPSDSVKSFSG